MSTIKLPIVFESKLSPFRQGLEEMKRSAKDAVFTVVGETKKISETAKTAGKDMAAIAAHAAIAAAGIKKAFDALASFAAEPMRQFSRYEDAAVRVAPLVGSLDDAKELAKTLRDEAANGVLSFEQLTAVASKLSAVFRDPEQILKWTRAFHDLSAGTGIDMDRIVGEFVKSKASGKMEASFLDMFAKRGVNLFEALAAATGRSAAEMRKMAADGSLSFDAVERAILSLSTGTGKFAGQAAALSNTLAGSFGTLRAEIDIVRAEIGESFGAQFASAAQLASSAIRASREEIAAFVADVARVSVPMLAVVAAAKALVPAISAAVAAAKSLAAATAATKAGLAGAVVTAAALAAELIWLREIEKEQSAMDGWLAASEALGEAFKKIDSASSVEELETFAKAAERAMERYAKARRNAEKEHGKPLGGLNLDTSREILSEKVAEMRAALAEKKRADADAAALAEHARAQALSDAESEKVAAAREAKQAEFDRTVLLLEAEISGNREKLALLREEIALRKAAAEYEQAGFSAAEARAKAERVAELETRVKLNAFAKDELAKRDGIGETTALADKLASLGVDRADADEYAALKAQAKNADAARGNAAGWSSFVGTALTEVGGGKAGFDAGETVMQSLQRQSVSLQEKMKDLLEKIAGKPTVSASGTATFA